MRRLLIVALALLSAAGCHRSRSSGNRGGGSGDNTPPTVISTLPAAGATGVVVYNPITATFSEAIVDSTIDATTFTLTGPGSAPVAGVVSYDEATTSATFLPSGPLAAATLFTARITTGVTDLDGDSMAADYVWTFTTTGDVTRPIVVSTTPASGATDVATNRMLVAYFNEPMKASTVTSMSFTVTGPGGIEPGVVTYDATNRSVTFKPTVPFLAGTTYTARITTAVEDAAGNSMAADYVWSFTTGLAADTTPPTVTSTNPVNGAIDVPINATVTAFFSEVMDASTLTTTTFTFTLDQSGVPVPGTVRCPAPGSFATFRPDSDLAISTVYDATITIGVQDLAGNALAVAYTWSFTTGLVAMTGPGAVNLGSADPFAILAGSAVTSTGPTVITGNVGLSPGSSVGGLAIFPLTGPGTVIGFIEIANPVADAAKLALTAAYLDAASRSVDSISCPGNLGGLTLAPGLYTNSTSVILSGTGPGGILTLDAGGDPTAVWIFQIGSSFTSDPATSIVLAGGALPENIYWQIGSSATLGTTCTFYGNILAQESITLNTGATLDGRALAQTSAVTMDSNPITRP